MDPEVQRFIEALEASQTTRIQPSDLATLSRARDLSQVIEWAEGMLVPEEDIRAAIEAVTGQRRQPGTARDVEEIMQTRVATDVAEQVANESGQELLRDEDGNVVYDGMGNPVLADGQTALLIGPNGEVTPYPAIGLPGEEEPPPFIGGFPEDYTQQDRRFENKMDIVSRLDRQARESIESVIGVDSSPRYRQWDQFANFASKSSEYQTQVQQSLVDAGLLDERDYVPGVWTFEAARAMEQAMAESNATGGTQSWVDILGQRARARRHLDSLEDDDGGERGALAGRRLTLPAFVEPDYASLSQSVKSLFRNQLGRDPLDWEVALLADQLNTDYRSQYDAEANALRSEFEAGNRAILLSEDSDDPTITSAGTVQGVDPVARLRERFESKYGPELELNEDRIEERQQLGNVFSILTQTSNLMGGGIR